jgi:hypothetical protein
VTRRRPLFHALTLHRPWEHAIAEGWKPVENRDWPPPPWLIGEFFGIHAGKKYDKEAAEWMRENLAQLGIKGLVPDDEASRSGKIVAVARLAGAIQVERVGEQLQARDVLGPLTPEQVAAVLRSPWAGGPWCWVPVDVVRLPEGVVCQGARKLWRVTNEIRDQVRAQYRAATQQKETTGA